MNTTNTTADQKTAKLDAAQHTLDTLEKLATRLHSDALNIREALNR